MSQEGFQTILLVTDGSPASLAAQQSALNLAQAHQATVKVVDTASPPSLASRWFNRNSEDLFEIVRADKTRKLAQIVDVFSEAGIAASAELLVGNSSAAIARLATEAQADLVIRYSKGPRSRQQGNFGTTARNLMRVCPCPLLLVGNRPIGDPHVVACVNPEHDDHENQAILDAALKLAQPSQKLMGLYCWKFYGQEYLDEYMTPEAVQQYLDQARDNYRSVFDEFLAGHQLDGFKRGFRMENGDPVEVIPQLCTLESVDVVVMSSASQNHPLHRLLGSTVEAVIDQLPCALMVVKPLGYRPPLPAAPGESSSNA